MAYDPEQYREPVVLDNTSTGTGTGYDPEAPRKDITKQSFRQLPTTANGGSHSVWDAMGAGATAEGASYNPVGLAKTALDTVTGNTEVADKSLPWLSMEGLGLSPVDPRALAIVGHTAMSRDPAALQRVIKERIPEAQFETDSKGQMTVQVPGGQKMYLDRPGFSPQKALYYGGQTAAAIASGGRSILGLAARGAGQQAASQAGSYSLGGAESPIDLPGTALAALMPAGLGMAGLGAVKAFERLNSVPGEGATAIAARARQLYRWGFGATEGDLTRSPAQLAIEDRAANAGAPAAQEHLTDFHTFNATRNQTNKRQIIGELSGDVAPGQKVADDYVPSEAMFGSRLNDQIRAHEAALRKAKDDAWGKFGDLSPDTAAGRSVSFSDAVSADVLAQSADTIRKVYGAPQGPGGTYTAAQLGKEGQAAVDALKQLRYGMMDETGGLKPFNLGTLQDMRQQLQNVINDNKGTSASVAAIQMKRALDKAIETAEKVPGRLSGDKQALIDFRDANKATRAHYQFAEPADNPAAEAYLGRVLSEPGYGGQQAVGDLFGGTGGVVSPGGGTNAVITHLQTHLGDNANKPVRGALTTRSMFGNKGTAEAGEGPAAKPTFDYVSTAERTAANARSDTGKLVFTPEMHDTLHDYAGALRTLSASNTAQAPRLNPSGSGYTAGMILGDLPFGLGGVLDKARSSAVARRATQRGGEIVDAAMRGANTPGDLGIRIPRTPNARLQALDDPNNPTFRWQNRAWNLGVPVYRGGGLLGMNEVER